MAGAGRPVGDIRAIGLNAAELTFGVLRAGPSRPRGGDAADSGPVGTSPQRYRALETCKTRDVFSRSLSAVGQSLC